MRSFLTFLTFCLIGVSVSQAYFIAIDAHTEECFFERLSTGVKMTLMFEVVEGGFLDIDLAVRISSMYYGFFNLSSLRSTIRMAIPVTPLNGNQVENTLLLLIKMVFTNTVLETKCPL